MTLSGEGLVILGIIIVMMLADLSYDGASRLLVQPDPEFHASEPGASLAALVSRGFRPTRSPSSRAPGSGRTRRSCSCS